MDSTHFQLNFCVFVNIVILLFLAAFHAIKFAPEKEGGGGGGNLEWVGCNWNFYNI